MKSQIKGGIKFISWLFHLLLNNRLTVYIGDSILKFKVEEKRMVTIKNKPFYLATPNFLMRYRHKTFFSKEPETIQWIDGFKKGSTFFDIGANIGLYSIYAAETSNANVYAFEPSFFNLEFLARNIYYNKLVQKINIIPIALNSSTGVNIFNLTTTEWGGALSSFDKSYDDSGKVMKPEFTYKTLGFNLDSLSNLMGVNNADYIKIDVDGLEHIILHGAKTVLKNAKEILIEVNDDFHEQKESVENLLIELEFYRDKKIHIDTLTDKFSNQIWKKKIK